MNKEEEEEEVIGYLNKNLHLIIHILPTLIFPTDLLYSKPADLE